MAKRKKVRIPLVFSTDTSVDIETLTYNTYIPPSATCINSVTTETIKEVGIDVATPDINYTLYTLSYSKEVETACEVISSPSTIYTLSCSKDVDYDCEIINSVNFSTVVQIARYKIPYKRFSFDVDLDEWKYTQSSDLSLNSFTYTIHLPKEEYIWKE